MELDDARRWTIHFVRPTWDLRTSALTTALGIACSVVSALDALLLSGAGAR